MICEPTPGRRQARAPHTGGLDPPGGARSHVPAGCTGFAVPPAGRHAGNCPAAEAQEALTSESRASR